MQSNDTIVSPPTATAASIGRYAEHYLQNLARHCKRELDRTDDPAERDAKAFMGIAICRARATVRTMIDRLDGRQ